MEQQLSADLLVIGGGFGGLFAAIHARKRGVRDVLIVDKGAVGLTGQSRMAAGATIFVHPGDDVDQWADALFRGQNGLCNQDMVESFLAHSTERLREIESLGVVYRGGGGEKYIRMPSRGLAPAMMTLFPQYRSMTGGSALTTALREQALGLGVRFCDKVFISDLIAQDGRAAGAVGCHRRTGEFYVFRSHAVVVAACDCSFPDHLQQPAGIKPERGKALCFLGYCVKNFTADSIRLKQSQHSLPFSRGNRSMDNNFLAVPGFVRDYIYTNAFDLA